MRMIVDIVHPADVLMYRNLIDDLSESGHETLILARAKDVTHDLLDAAGLAYETVGKAGKKGIVRLGWELTRRVSRLVRLGRRFRPDIVLTRNPAGVIAARVLGVPGVFDTDDGRAVGIYWKAAVPFASIITMPEAVTDDYRGRRVAYPSHKALAHLHPNRFSPDRSVRRDLGVADGEKYFIVRFVAMAAYHDRAEAGVSIDVRRAVIDLLQRRGRVFVSSEAPLADDLSQYAFRLPAHRMPDALAFSSALVGDSQSMATEAALLGVPTVRLSSWVGRLEGLIKITDEYGLIFEYSPDQTNEFMGKVEEIADVDDPEVWQESRRRLLEGKVDLTSWYRDFVIDVVGSGKGRRRWRSRRASGSDG